MKKKNVLFIFSLILFVCISGCDVLNPVIDPWWEGAPKEFSVGDRVILFLHEAYVVSFDSNGGTYVDEINGGTTNASPQRVLAHAYASVPGLVKQDPNEFFKGWYTEQSGGALWDFDSDPVEKDMTLYAQWDHNAGWLVTFDLNFPSGSGLEVVRDLTYRPVDERIANNARAAEPLQFGIRSNSPMVDKYVFIGWYTDPTVFTSATRYNFDSPVTAPTNLHAGWLDLNVTPKPVIHTIMFRSGTNSIPPNQYVRNTEKIIAPYVVYRSDYSFGGWYTDPLCTEPWDFDTDVPTKDMTLYAKWFPVDPVDIFKDLRILYFNYVLFAGGSTTYNETSHGSNASTLSPSEVKANDAVIASVRHLLETNPTYRVMIIGHANPTPEDQGNPTSPSLMQTSDGRVAAVKGKLLDVDDNGVNDLNYDTALTPILTSSEGGKQALQDPTLSRRGEIVVFDITTKTVTP